jgi:leader peptidase (prepilin peptidase)/N-methyltransferase
MMLIATLAGVAGATVGSYAATVAVRAGQGATAFSGRSRCDGCASHLGWPQTLPLVSAIALRGRCRACRQAIDPLHPAGEWAGAAVLLLAFWLTPWPASMLVAAVGLVLLGLALFDLKTLRLPNAAVLAVAGLCAGLAAFSDTLLIGVISSAVVWTALAGLRAILHRRLGQAALGNGDVKLCAALALWIGPGIALAMLLASAAALVVMVIRRSRGRIAFGPYLCAGGFAVGLCLQSPMVREWAPGLIGVLSW